MDKEIPEPIKRELYLSKDKFKFYLSQLSIELAQWVQYSGVVEDEDNINSYMKFKTSAYNLVFYIPLQTHVKNDCHWLLAYTNEIYKYFTNIKYEVLQSY